MYYQNNKIGLIEKIELRYYIFEKETETNLFHK